MYNKLTVMNLFPTFMTDNQNGVNAVQPSGIKQIKYVIELDVYIIQISSTCYFYLSYITNVMHQDNMHFRSSKEHKSLLLKEHPGRWT